MAMNQGGGMIPHRPMQRPIWNELWNHVRSMRALAGTGRSWPGGEITGMRHPPERLIPGDPDYGHAIYAERKTAADLTQFNQLNWIRHLTASGKTLHAIYAAGLLVTWAHGAQGKTRGSEGAKALMALATDAPAIALRMRSFLDDLLPMATRQAKQVFGWSPLTPEDKVLKGVALLSATVGFTGLHALRESAAQILSEGLDGLVLADGGHVSRQPEDLLKLLLLLVPLRQSMVFAHDMVPAALHGAIERMMPMLRMLCHGDGGLAHVQGAKPNIEAVACVLRTDQTMGEHLDVAPQSGIARIAAARLLLIADSGDAALDIDISYRETRLLSCRSDSGRALATAPALISEVQGGTILQLTANVAADAQSSSRTFLLSHHHDDLRCEEHVLADGYLQFAFADDVSVLDVGLTEIRFMAGDKSLWTIKQRGGVFEQGAEFQRAVRLEPDDPSKPSLINWALRKFSAD
jgi:hypothetical protein